MRRSLLLVLGFACLSAPLLSQVKRVVVRVCGQPEVVRSAITSNIRRRDLTPALTPERTVTLGHRWKQRTAAQSIPTPKYGPDTGGRSDWDS